MNHHVNTLLTLSSKVRRKFSPIRLPFVHFFARNSYMVLLSAITCDRAARENIRSAVDRAVVGPGFATGLGPVVVDPAAAHGVPATASNLHQQAEQTKAAASGRPTARPLIVAAAVVPGNEPSPSAPKIPCPLKQLQQRRRRPRDLIADAAPDDDELLPMLLLADRVGRSKPEVYAMTACQSRSRLRRPNRRRQWGG